MSLLVTVLLYKPKNTMYYHRNTAVESPLRLVNIWLMTLNHDRIVANVLHCTERAGPIEVEATGPPNGELK